jgi:hypothetical protein
VYHADRIITNVYVGLGIAAYRWSFLVVPDMPYQYLIGMDRIPHYNISFDWWRNEISIAVQPCDLAPGCHLRRGPNGKPVRRQRLPVYTTASPSTMPCRLVATAPVQ